MNTNKELSNTIRSNTETLINSFVIENKKLKALKKKKERKELTDKFTIALTGMLMLMNEIDREHIIKMLDSHELVKSIQKSVNRIKKNDIKESKRLQFGYG